VSDFEAIETADAVRVAVDFPEHWGTPAGEAGTPERRAWIIAKIREDSPEDRRSAAGALRQAEALRDTAL
jgi:hypothetical protein